MVLLTPGNIHILRRLGKQGPLLPSHAPHDDAGREWQSRLGFWRGAKDPGLEPLRVEHTCTLQIGQVRRVHGLADEVGRGHKLACLGFRHWVELPAGRMPIPEGATGFGLRRTALPFVGILVPADDTTSEAR